ncbi:MAG: hypothetical protein ACI9VS_000498 [Candidatus Binatia bacterium]|jgi:hypothetical protein
MKILRLILTLFCATGTVLVAAEPKTLLTDNFNRAELGKGWHVNTGEWKIVDGVLCVKEIKADKHSAAARRAIVTQDAVYEFRFRFVGEGKGFHFGFDPAKGELKKKGHLFSVIVTPDSWRLMKHVDKAKPKEDPNKVLATAKATFKKGEWYSLCVESKGDNVTASIKGVGELKGSHPTFHVKKPTLVFRCLGDGVEIDDIRVRQLSK